MGREVRRVPMDWEHPRHDNGQFIAQYDEPYEDAIAKWIGEHLLWLEGKHPDQLDEKYAEDSARYAYFAEYDRNPPCVEDYRVRKWTEEEATGWVMYETVSEGTPLTPVFATAEELVNFLCTHKDFWGKGPISRKAAERFVKSGYAPSFMMTASGFFSGIEFFDEIP